MGHFTLIDVMGSIVIAGFLLLMLFRLQGTVAESVFSDGNDLTVQQNLVSLVYILENDFRQIGYCADPTKLPDPTKYIVQATQTGLWFLSDPNADGTVDTIKYSIGTTAGASTTPNPNDRLLFRQVNSQPSSGYSLGLTQFFLTYYNAVGDTLTFPVTVPSTIFAMRLSVELQSPSAVDSVYSYAYWRQLRLAARNLKNR